MNNSKRSNSFCLEISVIPLSIDQPKVLFLVMSIIKEMSKELKIAIEPDKINIINGFLKKKVILKKAIKYTANCIRELNSSKTNILPDTE